MLRTTSGLSRPLLKWVSQVTASLGATLAATLIWSAVPHPGVASPPAPEMTSGGKFAARILQPVAFDGLDTMPLPHTAPVPILFATSSVEAPATPILHRASWEQPAPLPARLVRPARPLARAEPRRAASVPHVAAAAPVVAESEAGARADEGFLHAAIPSALPRILPVLVSTARDAWAVTASAGGSLVSHVVPQLP